MDEYNLRRDEKKIKNIKRIISRKEQRKQRCGTRNQIWNSEEIVEKSLKYNSKKVQV